MVNKRNKKLNSSGRTLNHEAFVELLLLFNFTVSHTEVLIITTSNLTRHFLGPLCSCARKMQVASAVDGVHVLD